jgi:hypothetical protein
VTSRGWPRTDTYKYVVAAPYIAVKVTIWLGV